MILQQYIQEVLFRQRVCVIPQLGTFTLQHFPAQYNVKTQTLTPPWEQVLFSQTYQDDGSCLEWIALKENLVPSVAQMKLEKYLEEMKTELKTGKPMELPGIGVLQGDFTGNIHFFAERLPVTQDTIDLQPIRQESETSKQPAAPVEPPNEAVEPIMTAEVEDTLEAIENEGGFKWWWAVIPVVLILGGVAAWWYVTQQHMSVDMAPPKTDSVAVTAPPVQQDSTAMAPVDSSAAVVAVPATDTLKYVAVYATFKNTPKDSTVAYKAFEKQQSWGRTQVIIFKDSLYKLAVPVNNADTTGEADRVSKEFGAKARLEKH
ncbi:hypothetical protein [Chitinophaga sp. Cy-1792]|uniref:HU domain-containing protein n=1 Tax=Chitinophaga sp. Cy-1792 TaxID=2608339 RepID=UPI001420743B|nr:hypothetical protein [Chitinophaga sp. Cy-1792]NIG53748.1 hypothetical protein [Chitinophaga sp. Cy-1792]